MHAGFVSFSCYRVGYSYTCTSYIAKLIASILYRWQYIMASQIKCNIILVQNRNHITKLKNNYTYLVYTYSYALH